MARKFKFIINFSDSRYYSAKRLLVFMMYVRETLPDVPRGRFRAFRSTQIFSGAQ